MIEIGKWQNLIVKNIKKKIIILGLKSDDKIEIPLIKEEVQKNIKVGDTIKVFIYPDAKNKIVATTKRTKGEVGDIVPLKVVSVVKFGAFLDLGIDKDVFLPLSETIGSVREGETYLVAIYLDREERITASMKLDKFLKTDHSFNKGSNVKGTIYSINDDLGAFVAVENKYNGLIPKEELIGVYKIGDIVEARVFNVKSDGKLDLSLRGNVQLAMAQDVNKVLEALKKGDGYLPLNDKSSPQEIKKELNMSKSAFKRAIGNLYREKMIDFHKKGIKLL